MPYIPQSRREVLDVYIDAMAQHMKDTAKEGSWIMDLEYTITRLATKTLRLMFKEIRHWQIKVVLGVLQSVQIEFYRRVASPYQNRQCDFNGDLKEFGEYSSDLYPEEGNDDGEDPERNIPEADSSR